MLQVDFIRVKLKFLFTLKPTRPQLYFPGFKRRYQLLWNKTNTAVQQRREIGMKWTCFNNRGRKGVEEEVAFQLSGWEMQVENNYNSDTHCMRGLTKIEGKCQ